MTGVVAHPSGTAKWLLGAVFLAFFLGTVGLFFWGPWYYPVEDGKGRLVAFLVAVHLAFAVGYAIGIRGTPRTSNRRIAIGSLVLAASVAELLLLFPTSFLNTGHWIPRPGIAMQDLGGAYADSISIRERSLPYVNYARILVAPFLALAVPLGVYYWHRLSWTTRVVFAVSIVGNIALFVAMGANAGAAHWMALFPWLVVAAHLAGVQQLDRKGWTGAAVVQLVSVGLFAIFFTATMNQRAGSFAKYGAIPSLGVELSAQVEPLVTAPSPATVVEPLPQPQVAPSSAPPPPPPVSPPTPPAERGSVRIGADGLAGYLTQGYFAVYLSLQEPFIPGYGVGNSVFLQRQVARMWNNDEILYRSYPERIQGRGWNAHGYWATIYPWIASDVTFPGTVLVVLAIGWMAGRVWLDVLGGRNPFAVAFLAQLLILLYYVPAHNKVMHSGEGVFAFWGLLIAWIVTRRTPAVRTMDA